MNILAKDVMTENVVSVPDFLDLRELGKLLVDRNISGAPVVDNDQNLVGVVSLTDLVLYNLSRDDELVFESDFYHSARMDSQHLLPGFQIEDCNTGTVSDIMTPVVHSVTENASISSVSRIMTKHHVHRVIVRKGKKIRGIISALDLLTVVGRIVKKKTASRKTSSRKTSSRKTSVK